MQSEAVKKTGRPSLKTPELIEEVCLRIAEGRSLISISKDEDMPDHSTLWRWMERDEDFRNRYARAIQARAMNHADGILDLEERLLRGEIPPDVARVALDARKWTAARLLPKVYGDKQIVEANVMHTHTLHLEALRALTSRRGNESGLIEAQAIDNAGNLTFSGERRDDPPLIEARAIASHATETPPGSYPYGGAAVAAHTSPHTDEKPSDPPPPPRAKRKPRAPKKYKKRDGEK